MLLSTSIEGLITANIYFSDLKLIIEKVELTDKRLTNYAIPFNDGQLEYIYRYFLEYFANTIDKSDIYKFIDFGTISDFYRSVYEETIQIPFGSTITYAELARRISKPKATRAVGQCLSKNKYPLIIPCHRVVGKKDLGGFKYGCELKKILLDREKLTYIL
jgi:methylated-DNA-[protein]-cysteine S-methyltransferase